MTKYGKIISSNTKGGIIFMLTNEIVEILQKYLYTTTYV